MNPPENYIDLNRRLWNEKTRHHIHSAFYDLPSFLAGRSSLNEIERNLLGDVAGKSILHLQCHFGQDSLSLARLGAQVTGVDFSEEAIRQAKEFSQKLKLNTDFICCDLYDLPVYSDKQFDIVFTSYGTIGWLPDLKRWADVVAGFLKPGGSFVFVEFHPVVWMFDNDFTHIQYSYFNKEVILEQTEGTYADKSAPVSLPSASWNHSVDEVLEPLLQADLQLKTFREFDYSPYNIFPDMSETEPGKFRMEKMKGKLPLVYALKMEKK